MEIYWLVGSEYLQLLSTKFKIELVTDSWVHVAGTDYKNG